jgi:hypothetical protein
MFTRLIISFITIILLTLISRRRSKGVVKWKRIKRT